VITVARATKGSGRKAGRGRQAPDTDGRLERGQASRARLLEVATELFTERGYEATSITDVLERSKLSRGAFYHHFPGKEALFEAVLESVEERVGATLRDAASGADDPVEAIRMGCRAWLDLASRDRTVVQITLIDAPSVVGWERWREIDEEHGLGLLIAGLAATRRIPDEILDATAHMLHAATLEAALIIARSGPRSSQAASVREALDELVDRLLS
jgi:AcrR family transcriptional regulator